MTFERNSPNKVSAEPGTEANHGKAASVPGEVRVLSLLEPWALLWCAGAARNAKAIETRGWSTNYRGIIAVHASKGFDRDARNLCMIEPFKSVLRDLGFASFDALPFGAVVGWVTLTDCVQMVGAEFCGHPKDDGEMCLKCDQRLTENERAFGNYRDGRVAWIADGPRQVLAQPIPMKGSLGLRDCPADIAERLFA